MLTDPTEIKIISAAKQPGVRDPKRSREHFRHIEADFFEGVEISGDRILDIGPGQYDWAVIAAERGASVVGVDRDPAVIELGRYKGYEVIEADLRKLTAEQLTGPYGGLFCKFTLNAFWFQEDVEALREQMGIILGSLAPDGWGWIAPWNGPPKKEEMSAKQLDRILETQAEIFGRAGFNRRELTEAESKRYGVNGSVANNVLFTRGLRG